MNHLKNDHLYADSKREEAEEYVKKHPPTTRKQKIDSIMYLRGLSLREAEDRYAIENADINMGEILGGK